MRVLHVTDHYPPVVGGIETHVAGLARRQALRGDTVTVLTSTPRTAEGRTSVDDGPVEVIRVRSLLEGLRVDLGRFDVVHAHVSVVAVSFTTVVGAFARRGVPTVVTVHSLWSGMGPFPMLAAAAAGLRGAPVTWSAVSQVAAYEVGLRVPRKARVHIIPNAVDAPPRPRTPDHDGVVRLVSTMRVAGRKRPLELLQVFDDLRKVTEVPVSLTIVGDGPLRPRFERLVRRLDLGRHVRVTGHVEPAQVLELLAGSDVYVAPAVLESFGLAALEARGVGLPVVGRLGTGLSDFIRDGVEGMLCVDDADMVGALGVLVHDDELRRQVSEHNRTVRHGLTWSRALRTHDEVYAIAGSEPPQKVLER